MSVLLTVAGAKVASAALDNGKKMLADISKGDSLVGYASAGMVEPTCLVDEDVRNSDMLTDTLQLAQSVFGAYYLRAFSMHNISIGNASVAARLDKFSTHRTGVGGGLSSLGLEEFEHRLVIDGDVRALPPDVQEIEDTVRAQVQASSATAAMESQVSGYTVKGQQSTGKNTPQSQHGTSVNQAIKQGLAGSDGSASVTIGTS